MKSDFVRSNRFLKGLLISTTIGTHCVFAAGYEGGGVPTALVANQAFNLLVLFAFLGFKLKAPIKRYFLERQSSFFERERRTQLALQQSQTRLQEVRARLEELKLGEETQLKIVTEEGRSFVERQREEAQKLAIKMRKEAESLLAFELDQARAALAADLFESSVKEYSAGSLKGAEAGQRMLIHRVESVAQL